MTPNAFENAIRVDMAMGGSTNTVLHIPAIAKEAGIDIGVDMFDRISRETPNLCSIIPAGPFEMADVDHAGGVPAVLNRLKPMLKENPTINGTSIIAVADAGRAGDDDVIRPLDNPYHEQGGIAVLSGNIAHSAIIKQTAVTPEMMTHRGPAKVFASEQALLDAIETRQIDEGDVVVLPFQGPAGAPGMPEMLTPTDAIKGAGYTRVALITDGRFSGGTSGPCVGHVEMEAFNGGPIGAIRDDDVIAIDIPGRSLNVELTDAQIRQRLAGTARPQRQLTPMLKKFRKDFEGVNCYGEEG